MSLLKPEYQQRTVQEAYHQMRGHAMWPSTFCWPEGFMRRWYPAAVCEHYVIATPDFVQVRTGVARNFVQDVHVGRQFDMDDVAKGGVPRLGAAVPRWYGETIGFWDKDVLITWTSNIQGWKSHSEFEFSNKMQSVEIYTPIRENGKFVGLNHEAILYDAEALAEPVRIVRNFRKINNFTDGEDAVRVHRLRADDLHGRRSQLAAHAGHQDRVRDAGHVQPAVGQDLGRVLRARHEQARSERGLVQLRQIVASSMMDAIELKAHVPAKDFELSKQFYQDLGFTLCWGTEGDLAYLHWGDHGSHGKAGFLLQRF